MDRHLVIRTLMTAVWQRQPKQEVLVHSDQGSQYSSHDYLNSMVDNNVKFPMSRGGNCYDSAVAESFLQRLKSDQ
jgi:putative transposase